MPTRPPKYLRIYSQLRTMALRLGLVACGSDGGVCGRCGGVDRVLGVCLCSLCFAGSDEAGCLVRYRVRPEQERSSRPGEYCTAVPSGSRLTFQVLFWRCADCRLPSDAVQLISSSLEQVSLDETNQARNNQAE